MIYIFASNYALYTSDMDAAYHFTSFLESMGYDVYTNIIHSQNEFPVTGIISLN